MHYYTFYTHEGRELVSIGSSAEDAVRNIGYKDLATLGVEIHEQTIQSNYYARSTEWVYKAPNRQHCRELFDKPSTDMLIEQLAKNSVISAQIIIPNIGAELSYRYYHTPGGPVLAYAVTVIDYSTLPGIVTEYFDPSQRDLAIEAYLHHLDFNSTDPYCIASKSLEQIGQSQSPEHLYRGLNKTERVHLLAYLQSMVNSTGLTIAQHYAILKQHAYYVAEGI